MTANGAVADEAKVSGATIAQELLSAITETIAAGILLHQGGHAMFVNRAMEAITGYSREELLSMTFDNIVHPEHRDLVRERALARLRGEKVISRYDMPVAACNGEVRWVDISATVIDYHGAPAVLATLIDITARKQAEAAHRDMERLLSQMLQGDPVPTFVINEKHVVTHWNRACEFITGIKADDIIGTSGQWQAFYDQERPVLADLVVDGATEQLGTYYQESHDTSAVVCEAWEAEGFFPNLGEHGLWLYFTAAPLKDTQGQLVGAIETLVDITQRKRSEESLKKAYDDLEMLVAKRTEQLAQAKAQLEADILKRQASETELRRRYGELEELNAKLRNAQEQLLQSEKMASIGQLAAGVAHEINNPIGFVQSNIVSLKGYIADLFQLLDVYQAAAKALPVDHPSALAAQELSRALDLEFIRGDTESMMTETRDGIDRVRKIVADLKDFSRVDSNQEWQWADLHRGLDSTLNIVNNEIKYKADVVKDYGDLPEVECLPSQLNQVFLNLLVNASHAMGKKRGTITIRTRREMDSVSVEIADNGSGIAPENLSRIFDPFFTTKPVGQGTGLGLSLAYSIVQKHHGKIEVRSEAGCGTTFRVTLPIKQTETRSTGA